MSSSSTSRQYTSHNKSRRTFPSQQRRPVLVPRPLGLVVAEIDAALPVKKVARVSERVGHYSSVEVEQRPESQPHVPSLVRYRGPAIRAADLHRQHPPAGVVGRPAPIELGAVEEQIVVATREPHVALSEDAHPLEGGAVELLAGAAVAELGVDGWAEDAVRDAAAVARCGIHLIGRIIPAGAGTVRQRVAILARLCGRRKLRIPPAVRMLLPPATRATVGLLLCEVVRHGRSRSCTVDTPHHFLCYCTLIASQAKKSGPAEPNQLL